MDEGLEPQLQRLRGRFWFVAGRAKAARAKLDELLQLTVAEILDEQLAERLA